MKKLIVVFGLIIAGSGVVTAAEFILKPNLDVAGSGKMEALGASVDYSAGTGFGLGAEVVDKVSDSVEIGAGFSYYFPRKMEKAKFLGVETALAQETLFNFVPIYGLARFNIFSGDNIKGFSKVQLGYNVIFDGNDNFKGSSTLSGGLHYAVGGGLAFSNALIEMMYSVDEGSSSGSGITAKMNYSKIALSVGLRLYVPFSLAIA